MRSPRRLNVVGRPLNLAVRWRRRVASHMAEWHHCWRCKKSVPMLDEGEWAQIEPLLQRQVRAVQRYREQHGCSLHEALMAVPTLEAQDRIYELTGYVEPNANAIWHHRLSRYGPPCRACGYLLRTRRASRCANCGVAT